MQLTFLGTSAGEEYPALWCRCENCEKARRLGGRNIRRYSCAWLAGDTFLDLSPQVLAQADRFGVPYMDAKHLLVTHSHEDHFCPFLLHWRVMSPKVTLPPPSDVAGPRFSPLPMLHLYGNERVCLGARHYADGAPEAYALEINQVHAFQPFEAGPMRVTPVEANHPDREGHSGLNYIIQRDGRTILYALDTGWPLPETYAEIARHQYDLVVLEGTFGFGVDSVSHMNLRKVEKARNLFEQDGLLKPGAPFVTSHISPHWTPVHDEVAPRMAEKGVTVAYDGLTVEF